MQVLVGPTPIPIRIRGAASASSNGPVQAASSITITPDNRIGIQQVIQGCLVDGWLRLEQAFAHDGVRMDVPVGSLGVAVLGLGVQPLLLSTYGNLPCLLLPSPDVLLVLPPNGLDLPIPAAVRPFTFYTQTVWIEGQSLPTTTGYRVTAY